MNKKIPTYQLNALTDQDLTTLDVLFLDRKLVENRAFINLPFRRNFYAVGICIKGKAELRVNLETYLIEPNCLITKPPYTINQWTSMSDDFETLTIFFTKNFITSNNNLNLDKFKFFEMGAKEVFNSSEKEATEIITSLNFIKQKYDSIHDYRNEMLKNHITSLLYEIAAIYEHENNAYQSIQTRSQLLTSEFKRLVYHHFLSERNLNFYAEKLFITSKHLTETVKEVTGKTAGEWIEEAVILEAKILLQNPSLTIAQIADILHFVDQSTFGKYFKNGTTMSPTTFKQQL